MIVVEFSVGLHRKVHTDAIPGSSIGGEAAGRLADRADGSALDALVDRAASLPGGDVPVDPPALPYLASRADVLNDHLAGALAGDREAVSRLLTAIRPAIVRYCRARVGRSASADDVAQEVCLAVLTALPSYRYQGRPFLAFVYGIAAHKVADAHRASARNRAEPVPEVPDRQSANDGPEEFVLQDELSGEMGRLLLLLPEKQREILVLRVVVGLSAEETAEAVGSTPGAVRVAQHRALARLRKAISDASE